MPALPPLSFHPADLTQFNTLRLRSHTDTLVKIQSPGQLDELSNLAQRFRHVFILGGGSNVVLAPELDALVIKPEMRGVRLRSQTEKEWIIEAGAGETWHDLVALCIASGWDGLENLALIPGTVGAAPVQNIGAYGVELEQRLHSVLAWDLRDRRMAEMSASDCRLSYRDSFFKHADSGRWLIVAVRLRLPRPWKPVLSYADLDKYERWKSRRDAISARDVFDAVCDIRRGKLPDPSTLANAGSFFKNPVVGLADYGVVKSFHHDVVAYPQADGRMKLAAGWMIDRAGWKGRRAGNVGIHERQALVLVNYGGATAAEVAALACDVRRDVLEQFGVRLEQEPISVS
jgi:UDP-N-acetylmuramate dehydrogenase